MIMDNYRQRGIFLYDNIVCYVVANSPLRKNGCLDNPYEQSYGLVLPTYPKLIPTY